MASGEAKKKHAVMMIAEDLPCGAKTLKASLPVGKHCTAQTLLQLFGKQFKLDSSRLALRTASGDAALHGKVRVRFDEELSVFTVVALPAETAEPLSAHATIATFEGTEGGRASFKIERYLRYAAITPADAEGCQERYEIDVSSADAQTEELADETTAALSTVVGALPAGARVELEWLQVLMPGAPRRVLRQTQKLEVVTPEAEAELVRKFPSPQLMVNTTPPPPVCLPCAPPPASS